MNWFQKIHWAALGSVAVTLAGVAASPAVMGVLPPKVAAGVIIGGAVLQAVTKPVQSGDQQLVPKSV